MFIVRMIFQTCRVMMRKWEEAIEIIDKDNYSGEEYRSIIKEVSNISVDTSADTLHEIELQIVQKQISISSYAGKAFLADDKEMMDFFKGQYIALKKLRKYVLKKYIELLAAEDKEESKTYAEHVKEQMITLKHYDHELFEDIVCGLRAQCWQEEGGSKTFRLLHKDDVTIKIFRDAEVPVVIKICFSAELEKMVK